MSSELIQINVANVEFRFRVRVAFTLAFSAMISETPKTVSKSKDILSYFGGGLDDFEEESQTQHRWDTVTVFWNPMCIDNKCHVFTVGKSDVCPQKVDFKDFDFDAAFYVWVNTTDGRVFENMQIKVAENDDSEVQNEIE